MAIESRIRELDTRHRRLEDAIHEETTRPAADTIKLAELKRRVAELSRRVDRRDARRRRLEDDAKG